MVYELHCSILYMHTNLGTELFQKGEDVLKKKKCLHLHVIQNLKLIPCSLDSMQPDLEKGDKSMYQQLTFY